MTEPRARHDAPRIGDAIDERDRTIAKLERDLASVRGLLLEYFDAREATDDALRASERRYRESEERYGALVRRTERMASLGHLLAGVAHELNNPLAAIGSFAELLLRQTWPDDDRIALETITHEAHRAGRIVRELLAFSRTQESHGSEPVDLNVVVRYIIGAQRYHIDTQGIRHELVLGDDLPAVLAQTSQIEQVVLNLIINARQALEQSIDDQSASRRAGRTIAQPLITVRTAASGGNVVLEVADNGPGIPEDHRARIWDPFWTTKKADDGTGLGLSVIHSIVTGYGGRVEVHSEVGVGTRFVVSLPAAAASRVA